jgi:hypothetical protein
MVSIILAETLYPTSVHKNRGARVAPRPGSNYPSLGASVIGRLASELSLGEDNNERIVDATTLAVLHCALVCILVGCELQDQTVCGSEGGYDYRLDPQQTFTISLGQTCYRNRTGVRVFPNLKCLVLASSGVEYKVPTRMGRFV